MLELNKIYNEDCLEGMKRIPDGSVDLIVTSPPYFNAREYSQWETLEEYLSDMKDILKECKRVVKNHKYIIYNVGDIVSHIGGAKWNTRKLPLGAYFTTMMEGLGLLFIDDIIWDKGEPQSKRNLGNPPFPYYQYPVNVYEHILIFRKSDINTQKIACPVCDDTIVVSNSQSSIGVQSWECKNPKCPQKSKSGRGKRFSERSIMMESYKIDANKIDEEILKKWRRDIVRLNPVYKINNKKENTIGHSAPFPIDIPEMALSFYTGVGDLVLDPFLGSGTTAIACINTNRNYIGFELDKRYCDIANERIQKAVADSTRKEMD